MKYVLTLGVILAASQCPSVPTGVEEGSDETVETTAEEPDASTEEAPDTGSADAGSTPDAAWLEPGPPPFDVPTRRIALPGYDATMRVPVGTDVLLGREKVEVRLGEGKNFWFEVSDAFIDLDEVRELQESETAGFDDRWEDAVVWNEAEHWFFQYSGAFSCSNPANARHDLGDVELMIAACRSIEPADESAPSPTEQPD